MEFPLWFGPAERSLFATACLPDDAHVSGAVVLCPPLGLEGVCARRTFASLGRMLAGAGLLAFRIDYDGTGDSSGSNSDSDRVAAWMGSVRHAVTLARQSGAPRVAVVGMRLGATLAAAGLGDAGQEPGGELVDGLVLWDPCVSGRMYLRAQQALHFFSVESGERADGSVEVPGLVFAAETVAELNSLDLAGAEGPLARRILVLARERLPHGSKAIERFVAGHQVERLTAHGQEQLVDVEPFAAEIPWADLEAVSAWLSDALKGERVPVSVPQRMEALVGEGGAGPIVERPVSLGPHGLFGMVTEPRGAGGKPGDGPTAIFLNAGVIDHAGPSRLWVDLGRRWAEGGVRSLRCDLSGIGESPPRPGGPVDITHPPEAIEDVVEVATAVSPGNPADVVLVGLCSGGYHAIEGGIALGARGVCAINPMFPYKPAELLSEVSPGSGRVDSRRQAAPARKRWIRALPAHDQLGALLERMPGPVWWLVNRVAVEHSPAQAIRRLVGQGVQTFIICGKREQGIMWRGEGRLRRRLERSRQFQQVVAAGIDHELFKRDARDLATKILSEHMVTTYGSIDSDQHAHVET